MKSFHYSSVLSVLIICLTLFCRRSQSTHRVFYFEYWPDALCWSAVWLRVRLALLRASWHCCGLHLGCFWNASSEVVVWYRLKKNAKLMWQSVFVAAVWQLAFLPRLLSVAVLWQLTLLNSNVLKRSYRTTYPFGKLIHTWNWSLQIPSKFLVFYRCSLSEVIFNLPKRWWIILVMLEKYSTWEFHRNTYIIRVFDDALVLRVIWTEELNLCFVVFHTLRFPVQLTVKTREKYVTPGGITRNTHKGLTQNNYQLFFGLNACNVIQHLFSCHLEMSWNICPVHGKKTSKHRWNRTTTL